MSLEYEVKTFACSRPYSAPELNLLKTEYNPSSTITHLTHPVEGSIMDDITGISSLVGNVLNLEVDDPIQKLKNELEAEKEKTITANDQIRVLTSDVEHTAQKANEKVSELEAQLRDREHTPSEELAQMRHAMLEMARGKEAAEEANRDLDVKLTEVELELKGANAKALVVGGDIEAAAAAQSYVCMGVFPLAGDNSLNGLWPDGQVSSGTATSWASSLHN